MVVLIVPRHILFRINISYRCDYRISGSMTYQEFLYPEESEVEPIA